MAVVFFDGLDLYNTATNANQGMASAVTRWSVTGGSLVAGRFGGQAFSSTNSSNLVEALLPSSYGSIAVGMALKIVLTGSGNFGYFLSFRDSASAYQVGLSVGSTGIISAYRATSGSAGTLLGSSAAPVITTNAWHYLEVELTISDTVGTITVYVDSVAVITLTGQDTRSGLATVQRVLLGGTMNTSTHSYTYDDFYVVDTNVKLGERMVEALRPNADTADADWTPLSGTDRFAMVDDTTCDGSTTYNSASVVGDYDLYDLSNLSSTPAVINGVRIFGWSQKSDALGGRQICLPVKSGATTQDGSNFVLASSAWAYNERGMFLTDPNTGVAWTAAGVNALQVGAKVTA